MELINLIYQWLELLKEATPIAVVQAVVVLVCVIGLRLVKLVPDSNWARAANAVLSVLLTGITPTQDNGVIVPMTMIMAGLLWDACSWAYEKLLKQGHPFKAVSKKK